MEKAFLPFMCLAIPGKVIEINSNMATVDYGSLTREINISLVEVEIGSYVLVHAGYAIQVLQEEEAKKTLEIWDEILSEM